MAFFPNVADESRGVVDDCDYQPQPASDGQPTKRPICGRVDHYRCQAQQNQNRKKQSKRRPFGAARLSIAPNFAEQQAQIIRRAFEGVRFTHVGLTPQPTPSPTASLTYVGKRSFASFAAPTIQL